MESSESSNQVRFLVPSRHNPNRNAKDHVLSGDGTESICSHGNTMIPENFEVSEKRSGAGLCNSCARKAGLLRPSS